VNMILEYEKMQKEDWEKIKNKIEEQKGKITWLTHPPFIHSDTQEMELAQKHHPYTKEEALDYHFTLNQELRKENEGPIVVMVEDKKYDMMKEGLKGVKRDIILIRSENKFPIPKRKTTYSASVKGLINNMKKAGVKEVRLGGEAYYGEKPHDRRRCVVNMKRLLERHYEFGEGPIPLLLRVIAPRTGINVNIDEKLTLPKRTARRH